MNFDNFEEDFDEIDFEDFFMGFCFEYFLEEIECFDLRYLHFVVGNHSYFEVTCLIGFECLCALTCCFGDFGLIGKVGFSTLIGWITNLDLS